MLEKLNIVFLSTINHEQAICDVGIPDNVESKFQNDRIVWIQMYSDGHSRKYEKWAM